MIQGTDNKKRYTFKICAALFMFPDKKLGHSPRTENSNLKNLKFFPSYN
jgi:hypothetical protein